MRLEKITDEKPARDGVVVVSVVSVDKAAYVPMVGDAIGAFRIECIVEAGIAVEWIQ